MVAAKAAAVTPRAIDLPRLLTTIHLISFDVSDRVERPGVGLFLYLFTRNAGIESAHGAPLRRVADRKGCWVRPPGGRRRREKMRCTRMEMPFGGNEER